MITKLVVIIVVLVALLFCGSVLHDKEMSEIHQNHAHMSMVAQRAQGGDILDEETACSDGGGFTRIDDRGTYTLAYYYFPCDEQGHYSAETAAGIGFALAYMSELVGKGHEMEVHYEKVFEVNGSPCNRLTILSPHP